MGADGAPRVEVEGILSALADPGVSIILVGDEACVGPLVEEFIENPLRERVEIRHATEVIGMDEAPAAAFKHKKDSSMRVAFELAKAGAADAVVSAGNSGAMLACGLFVFGRIEGVERPAIVTTFPTKTGQCALLDMGANVEPKPTVLAQFAVLGSVYARVCHKKARPRVGLLSNGTEEHKGTTLTRETHHLLDRTGSRGEFEYLGYIEGRDIFSGKADVVVTDGFTGNIVLKSCEGLVEEVALMMRKEVAQGGLLEKVGGLLMKPALQRFKSRIDYAETGGAPLLGVDGVAMICHGGSDARAIMNAIWVARDFTAASLREELRKAVAAHAFLWENPPVIA